MTDQQGASNGSEVVVPLGAEHDLVQLYSYPNAPGTEAEESLAETILYWFGQTLKRDGYVARGCSAKVAIEGKEYSLVLSGPADCCREMVGYRERMARFLQHGAAALQVVAGMRKPVWDPLDEGWRFFLPHGLPMLNQRSIQFFHFPPIRLLDTYRDYLVDPVPVRWGELLGANGVLEAEQPLYETIVDSTPIGAPDNAGIRIAKIPGHTFKAYQRAQVELYLNVSPVNPDFTIPVVVPGVQPMAKFEELFGVNLDFMVAQTAVDIIPGKHTACLGLTHPYHFYVAAQLERKNKVPIGSGHLGMNAKMASILMLQDLIAARWQVKMAEDPSQDPDTVLSECTAYWTDPSQEEEVCALVQHEGSLKTTGQSGTFEFGMTLEEGREFCRAHGNDACACVKKQGCS
ncbi:MAG: hypothetical protein KKI08_19690 [Armatimonadetes bacterium]|nr:hypothetical protein [Armatimonadota bacterium]